MTPIVSMFVGPALLFPAFGPPPVIDGRFEDWSSIRTIEDDPSDGKGSEIDFIGVAVTASDTAFYLHLQHQADVNIAGLDGSMELVLDTDGDARSGAFAHGLDGVDVTVTFSPRNKQHPEKRGMGVAATLHGSGGAAPQTVRSYDVGLLYGPTYAHRSIELRFDRGARSPQGQPIFRGPVVRGKWVYIDGNGTVRDETEVFDIGLPVGAPAPAPSTGPDPLARPAETDMRVMVWNSRFGAIFEQPQRYGRLLRAVRPDVILFQELTEDHDAAELSVLLSAESKQDWNIEWGEGGGRLRCAVASRLPMTPSVAFRKLDNPLRNNAQVKSAGAVIEVDGTRVLLVSAHLKCCGRIGSKEDKARITEVEVIRNTLDQQRQQMKAAAVVVAGDYNLVGSRTPLDVLVTGLRSGDERLHIAEPMQLDGLSNATWSDAGNAFAPGRLDYMVYSDRVRPVRAIVLDSTDLTPHWLGHYGLKADDTTEASDHLPLIIDLAARPAPAARD